MHKCLTRLECYRNDFVFSIIFKGVIKRILVWKMYREYKILTAGPINHTSLYSVFVKTYYGT